MQFIHNQCLNEVLNLVEEDVLGPRISYHSGSLHITDNFCAWRLEVCWQMSAESCPLWYQQCFVMRFQSQGLPLAWCFIENQSSVFSLWSTWCGLISKKTRFHFFTEVFFGFLSLPAGMPHWDWVLAFKRSRKRDFTTSPAINGSVRVFTLQPH